MHRKPIYLERIQIMNNHIGFEKCILYRDIHKKSLIYSFEWKWFLVKYWQQSHEWKIDEKMGQIQRRRCKISHCKCKLQFVFQVTAYHQFRNSIIVTRGNEMHSAMQWYILHFASNDWLSNEIQFHCNTFQLWNDATATNRIDQSIDSTQSLQIFRIFEPDAGARVFPADNYWHGIIRNVSHEKWLQIVRWNS